MGNRATAHPTSVVQLRAAGGLPREIIGADFAKTDAGLGIYTITPAIAANWLKQNKDNRVMSEARVIMLADDITRGYWKVNGETIKFSKEGALLDGQHRLSAIVKSGKPIISAVMTNLDPDSFDTLDVGMKRTPAQLFAIAGEPHPQLTSAFTNIYIRYKNGLSGLTEKTGRAVSFQQQRRVLRENEDMRETIDLLGGRNMHGVRGGKAVPALIHYLAKKKHGPTAAREFVLGVFAPPNEGAEFAMTSPLRHLREILHAPKKRVARWSQEMVLAYYIPAWNGYAENKRMRSLTPLNWDVIDASDLKLA